MVLQLIIVEKCRADIRYTPGGSEYYVPTDCRLVAVTTISSLERALRMLFRDDDVVAWLVHTYENEGIVDECNERICVRIRPVFVVF